MTYPGLEDRVARVRERIAHHQRIGNWAHPVGIVAVVKGHPAHAVRRAVEAGLTMVGENRVQEALAKQDQLADVPVDWHLIGTIQRNKVRHLVGRFALLHAVDRPELVDALAGRLSAQAPQPVLIEVNCSGEPQKAGVEPEELPALVDRIRGCDGLRLEGLMTMAPFTEDEAVQRACFRRLRALRDAEQARGTPLPELSMGMSGDFTVAVEEGATLVRLGTILFGERTR